MSYYQSPFQMLTALSSIPYGKDVYVVSDSQYQELRQKEASKEIEILRGRAAAYRKTADLIEDDIMRIQKEVGLLPSSDESTDKTD
jgi:hypothetical protein